MSKITKEIEDAVAILQKHCKDNEIAMLCAVMDNEEQISTAHGKSEDVAFALANLIIKLTGRHYKPFMQNLRKLIEEIYEEQKSGEDLQQEA